MDQDVPEFSHFSESLFYFRIDRSCFSQYGKCIGVAGWSPQTLVAYNMVGDISADFEHDLERTFDNSLGFPVRAIIGDSDRCELAQLLGGLVKFAKFSQDKRAVNQGGTAL